MSVADVSRVLVELIEYCIPAAFVINLTSYGINAIIAAATGKGVKL